MRVLSALGAAALGFVVSGPALAAVTTIDFTEDAFPGPFVDASNEYAAYGVLFSNAYYYTDSRDPFDDQGLSNGDLADQFEPGATGRIDFTGGTSDFFSFDWWALAGTIHVNAYDAGGNLLDQFVGEPATATTITSGSETLTGSAISYVTWHDFGGFVQLSTIGYDLEVIPLPATLPMLAGALGLGGLVARRRKGRA